MALFSYCQKSCELCHNYR